MKQYTEEQHQKLARQLAAQHIRYACTQHSLCLEIEGQGRYDLIPLKDMLDYADSIERGVQ